MKNNYVCDKCFDCENYWQNNDTENECRGQKEPCHEFIKARLLNDTEKL